MKWLSQECPVIIAYLAVLCHFESAPPPDPDKSKSQYYEINVENLKGMWHNAMIRGLIKVLLLHALLLSSRIFQSVLSLDTL